MVGGGLQSSGKSKKHSNPDWKRFGLASSDNEEKTAIHTDHEKYGSGGAVSEKEIFSEDQGNRAKPWWMADLFLSEKVLFGTWDGVFSSCMINIFGVIVFLRSGWIVAEAGILQSVMIVVAALMLILVAVLSAIGICERCSIDCGGIYYLISHVLGSRTGTVVGIVYIMGQAVGNALCATGFGESIADLLNQNHPFLERGIAALVIVLLTLVNLMGVKWVIRLQFLLLFALLLATLDFAVGSVSHSAPEHGFVGWNLTVWKNNTFSGYTEHNNWFTVFGVFFPAFTGILAGINMSGELKNPTNDISKGTLAAVFCGTFLYLGFMLILGGTCDREALLNDYLIAEKVSGVGFLLLAGLYLSSVSSCLGTLCGTPRVLQSIANENVLPSIFVLGKGRGPNKDPVYALLTLSFVTLIFIFIGKINRLATLATIPFLVTYATIEYAYFVLCQQFDMNRAIVQTYQARALLSPTFQQRKASGDEANSSSFHSSLVSSPGDDRTSADESHTERSYSADDAETLVGRSAIVSSIGMDGETMTYWYSRFFNRWCSLLGCAIKLAMLFCINWLYSALMVLLMVVLWFYIGHSAHGIYPGIANEFSLVSSVRQQLQKLFGRQEKAIDEVVVTSMHPSLEAQASQINEENEDFSGRSKFHQSRTLEIEREAE